VQPFFAPSIGDFTLLLGSAGGPTAQVAHLVLQLGIILLAAKLFGEVCERWLHQPSVLGELVAGMVIGPFALGPWIVLPGVGALFELPHHEGAEALIPVSFELYAIAQIAAVILLFVAGLETDLPRFLRYAGRASAVALGGVVLPFVFGVAATFLWGLDDSLFGGKALFMGVIMVATSVGITARVLSDIGKLGTAEGVTILGGAVVDDVVGIIILTVVVAMGGGAELTAGGIIMIVVKAVVFWVVLMAVGILGSGWIEKFLRSFRVSGGPLAVSLALAYIVAAFAELGAGLAMIIGAYTIGLALSGSDIAEDLVEWLAPVYHAMVPIFFVVMGMMVNYGAMWSLIWFGLVITALAFISKIVGSGLPALAVGFNARGAWRIGLGMLPRGEVALIVAGVGMASGVIGPDIYGVAILMTVATTVAAPILLVPAFRGGSGERRERTGPAAGTGSESEA